MYTPLGVNMETTFSAGLLVKSSDAQAFSSIRSITSTTESIKTNQGYVNKYYIMSFHIEYGMEKCVIKYSTVHVPKVKIIFKLSLLFHINSHFFKPYAYNEVTSYPILIKFSPINSKF